MALFEVAIHHCFAVIATRIFHRFHTYLFHNLCKLWHCICSSIHLRMVFDEGFDFTDNDKCITHLLLRGCNYFSICIQSYRNMGKIFKQGLFALAPVVISLAIVIWLLKVLEGIFRVPLEWLVGQHYFPGLGIMVALVFIFFVGVLFNSFVMQRLTKLFDRLLARIPFFKVFYNSVTDLMGFFKSDDSSKRGKMVVVDIGDMRFLALLTREDFTGFPDELGEGDRVTVFVPLSYQIGGFTATVPRSAIKPVDMTVEEGMRFVVSAGLLSKNQKA